MKQWHANLLWLKDMLEHLTDCHEQLEWTEDNSTFRILTETMIRDLDCCRGLCENLRQEREALVAV
jgi:hypothetical protein